MIRVGRTDRYGRVIAIRIDRAGFYLAAIIPLRWIGTAALATLIGWSAATLAS